MNASELTIVLVHGGFVDGSGWEGVHDILKNDGYKVAIDQNPRTSLADDVRSQKRVVAAQPGQSLLVGHSYGGVVITEAGTDPQVAGLVYIAAFAPDQGRVGGPSLIKDPPPAPRCRRSCAARTVSCSSTLEFAASFAADVSEPKASFMAASQVPWGVAALTGEVSVPAWKSRPSWYLVASDDRMIPPPAQRQMAQRAGAVVGEVPGSHAVYVSRPQAVAALIEKAAAALSK